MTQYWKMPLLSGNKNILDSGYKTFNNMEEGKDFPLVAKIFDEDGTEVAKLPQWGYWRRDKSHPLSGHCILVLCLKELFL